MQQNELNSGTCGIFFEQANAYVFRLWICDDSINVPLVLVGFVVSFNCNAANSHYTVVIVLQFMHHFVMEL